MRVIIEQLRKVYHDRRGQDVTALQAIDSDVEPKTFVAVLGLSGCGKSTLLGILAGLVPATSGRVIFEGSRRPGTPLTATVFQEFALFPWRTAQRNVELGLEEMAVPAAERAARARRYLHMAGLAGFEDRSSHQLSGDMRQRVGIARARGGAGGPPDGRALLGARRADAPDHDGRAPPDLGTDATKHRLRHAQHPGVVLSRRPARILEIVDVDLPCPRTEAQYGDPAFVRTVERI